MDTDALIKSLADAVGTHTALLTMKNQRIADLEAQVAAGGLTPAQKTAFQAAVDALVALGKS